jgi:hypothetical protein
MEFLTGLIVGCIIIVIPYLIGRFVNWLMDEDGDDVQPWLVGAATIFIMFIFIAACAVLGEVVLHLFERV